MPEYKNVAISPESKQKLEAMCAKTKLGLGAQVELWIDQQYETMFKSPTLCAPADAVDAPVLVVLPPALKDGE